MQCKVSEQRIELMLIKKLWAILDKIADCRIDDPDEYVIDKLRKLDPRPGYRPTYQGALDEIRKHQPHEYSEIHTRACCAQCREGNHCGGKVWQSVNPALAERIFCTCNCSVCGSKVPVNVDEIDYLYGQAH